jgi:hypothetical protein
MVSNTTQHPTPLSAALYFDFGKGRRGGGGKPEIRLEGEKFMKLGQNQT